MKEIRLIILNIFIIGCCYAQAQAGKIRMSASDYIERYKDDAIRDMIKTKVPASITLAQGMFESDYGNSPLATEANNHFGIKCHKEWTGPTYIQDDDEKNECFRKYKSVLESFDDHSDFLRTRDRYKSLFELDITDYKGWAYGLKKSGYATNPQYADRIIKIIDENNLNELDKKGEKLIGKKFITDNNNNLVEEKIAPVKNTAKPIFATQSLNEISNIKVSKGDTWYKLAKENNLMLAEILSFNDATQEDKLYEGEVIYIAKKHSRAKQEFHIVKQGETMYYISQLYGVKLNKLCRRNHVDEKVELKVGTQIRLK